MVKYKLKFTNGLDVSAVKYGVGDATVQNLVRCESDAYKVYMNTPKDHQAQYIQKFFQDRSSLCV